MANGVWAVIVLAVVLVGFAVFAMRTRRSGESFSDAMDRVLNTPSHKKREEKRRADLAGLTDDQEAP